MFVKEICKKCYGLNRTRTWEKVPQKEITWNRGRLACVATLDVKKLIRYHKITEDPPIECYYRLEHLLEQDQK